MPLSAGTHLGPYEIVAPLGAGGMGEVYRARDTRLGRDVAIKVLPQHLSSNPEIRARFEREAKTVSGLNHPNICTLFDVGRAPGEAGSGDIDFLVMELVEGDTLAERLKRGPLSAAEQLRFGAQIADALDRAHRAGVIHRDLKPGNVMLTRSGAKLMDFGLSRVTGMAGSASGSGAGRTALTQSPTVAQALTAEGTLLGTFQYMSPEQLEGKEADARSDIWALGCVLYEMATGRRAFEGRSQASLIAAILERQPAPVGEAPSGSAAAAFDGPPAGIERLIRNCLAKDPDERIQTAHDVKLQLQGIAEGAGISSASVASAPAVALPARARPAGNAVVAWAVAAAALLLAAGTFLWLRPRGPVTQTGVRFRIEDIPRSLEMFWPRISPDGRYLVIEAVDSSSTVRAWLRPLDEVNVRPIPGTEGSQRVYWSPDSREVVFVVGDKMQRVAITGSSPTLICAAPGGADLSWGAKGMILMDGRTTDSLRSVPAGGGELRPASHVSRAEHEIGSAWPCFLPDGEHFLFIGVTSSGSADIRLGRLGSLDSKLIGHSDGRVEYAPDGWVLFTRGSTLLAQKLDLSAAKLTGEPITIVDDLRVGSSLGHFSISNTGVLALSRTAGNQDDELRLGDRRGLLPGNALVRGAISNPRPSPDGKRLLYQRSTGEAGQAGEIYVYDLERATDTRLTFTGNRAMSPEWGPTGGRFAYAVHSTAGDARLLMASSDGLGAADSIVLGQLGGTLTQWLADGSRLLFFSALFRTFYVFADGPDRAPHPLADTTGIFVHAQVSPDGRWLAGVSGTANNPQVFVQTLGGPPGRWQISTRTGIFPRWTRGGRELMFEDIDGNLMAVDIDARTGFHAGTPHLLFKLPVRAFAPDASTWGCDASGEHFYLVVPPRTPGAGIIEVTTDFRSLVSRR